MIKTAAAAAHTHTTAQWAHPFCDGGVAGRAVTILKHLCIMYLNNVNCIRIK